MECIFQITVYMYNIYFKIYYPNFTSTTLKYFPLIGTYYLHFFLVYHLSDVDEKITYTHGETNKSLPALITSSGQMNTSHPGSKSKSLPKLIFS